MTIFRWAMRAASPILFAISILIVLASFMQVYDTVSQAQSMGLDGMRTLSRFHILIAAVGQSLLLAALPFGTAAIIYRIDKFVSVRGEPGA